MRKENLRWKDGVMQLEQDPILISALNEYVFCPRRCALKQIEGLWGDNQHTTAGTLLHNHADAPGYETIGDVTVLRALPLYSDRYGLTGKADIVELHEGEPVPVEYKKGRRRKFDNDEIQLCAQAFCLEEMFACEVPVGYIYHAASKRRREVLFDWRLRDQTARTITAVREMLAAAVTPAAELKPRCDGCSLRRICMPELFPSSPAGDLQAQYLAHLYSSNWE
jgi:CRISPR-associated exonuclease Cas4